eukprot:TCONS_00050291-protein
MLPHPPSGSKKPKPLAHESKIKFPGTGKALKDPQKSDSRSFNSWREPSNEMKKRATSKKKAEPPHREGSFSHYAPLPAIGAAHEEKQHLNGKRSLPKSAEKQYPPNGDDNLLKTIKRMKLGMDDIMPEAPGTSSIQRAASHQAQYYISKHQCYNIELMIRLPKGSKIQYTFKSTDTLETVLKYLSKEMKVALPLSKFVLYLNQVPKIELNELKKTLFELGIFDRSVLTLDTRD